MLSKNHTVMAITAEYSKFLINCNDLQSRGFGAWNFASGTLFEQSEQWWVATGGTRPNLHEGIDFCAFADQAGQKVLLDETFKVPVMFDGKVVDIFDDFLKETLLVAHDYYVDGWQLHSLYGHVQPKANMSPGVEVMAGDIIATVAPQKHPLITPHLHLSVLQVDKDCRGPIRWQSIRNPGLRLCNPLDYINDMVLFLRMTSLWYVYMVLCSDGSLYTGIATDLKRRVAEHNSETGGAKYTRSRQPVKLVYSEQVESRSIAAKREYQIKKMPTLQKRKLIGA